MVFKLAEKRRICAKVSNAVQVLACIHHYKTASSEVVNHASTVNVFICKNSQFELPQISFHRLIGEALLFLWNTIFLMKAMYQEGIFAVEKWQN